MHYPVEASKNSQHADVRAVPGAASYNTDPFYKKPRHAVKLACTPKNHILYLCPEVLLGRFLGRMWFVRVNNHLAVTLRQRCTTVE